MKYSNGVYQVYIYLPAWRLDFQLVVTIVIKSKLSGNFH